MIPKFPILSAITLFGLFIINSEASFSANTPQQNIDHPLSAQEAVTFAIAQNPDATLALRRIDEAEKTIELADSSNYPRINLSAGYSQTDNPMYSFGNILNQGAFDNSIDFNDPGRTDDLELKAIISYRLYNGGKDQASQKGAAIDLEIKKTELALVHQQLGFEVVRAYQTIIEAQNMVGVRQESLAAITASLEVGKARFEAGDLLKQDLLNLELQQSRASESLIQSRHKLELSKRIFLNLLGLNEADIDIAMATDLGQQVPEQITPENRLELKKIDMLRQVAETEMQKAEGGRLPTLDGFASYQVDNGFVLEESGDSWMAGIKLDYALFDGRQTSSEIAVAKIKLQEINTMRTKTELALHLDIQQAELAYKQAQERLLVSQKMVAVAEEVANLSRARFKEGVILASDLIDFEMRLSDAQASHLTARTAVQVAIANLRRAAGLQQFPL